MNKIKGGKVTPNSKPGHSKNNSSQKKSPGKSATAFIMPELQVHAKLMELRLPIS
ncbi:MAG: hypothetical protein JSS82_04595 [Bacteroidetes bacterium]|nr:hypothetical protein [Bacteroidota bacterium]